MAKSKKEKGLKIVQLTARNIKRLKVVRIKPTGDLIEVRGKNGQGKSSVLDCIVYALKGGRSLPSETIRRGEDAGEINIDLGPILVKRIFTAKRSYLEITRTDGQKVASPQAFLDELIGQVSFDPLEFVAIGKNPEGKRQQREIILEMLGLDFSQADTRIAELYELRRNKKRERDDLKASAQSVSFPDDTPDEEIDVSKLAEKSRKATENNQELQSALDEIESNKITLEQLRSNIETLKLQEQALVKCQDALADSILDEKPVDVDSIIAEINAAQTINQNVRNKTIKASKLEDVEALGEVIARQDSEIESLRASKVQKLANSKMPIDGLGITDDSVIFNDLPIDQISDSEKLRIGLAVSMKLNPKLKVLRTVHGSLLDKESFGIVESMCKEAGFQIWIEKVADGQGWYCPKCDEFVKPETVTHDEIHTSCGGSVAYQNPGIFIEDGEVRNVKK